MANIQSQRWKLSRRQTLRGIGATMALPFLEAMRPIGAYAQGVNAADPVRMACLFMPNGVRPDRWTPKGKGSSFELSPILSPLEALKEQILVISGLSNRPAHHGDGHYFKTASWLTCTTIEKTQGSNISANGISIDQIAAAAIGGETRLPSMELGIEPVTSGVDRNVNLTRLYGSHISWRKPDVPLPCEINPRVAFDRLFRNRDKLATGGAAANSDKSILDIVLDDARSLKRRLGTEDSHKLEQYLESVHEVERRITNEEQQLGSGQNISPAAQKQLEALESRIKKATKSGGNDLGSMQRIDPTEHVRLMMDIMVLGFWTDSTRISTFMFANAVSNKSFSFLDGVSGAHHSISHHKNDPKQMDQYQKINTWHTEQYAYMLQRMKDIPEGNATLLDNSMVLFGSGIRDGNRHSPDNIPIVLAGGANGQIKTGRHLDTGGDGALAALHLGMLKRLGVPTREVGDASRELRGL